MPGLKEAMKRVVVGDLVVKAQQAIKVKGNPGQVYRWIRDCIDERLMHWSLNTTAAYFQTLETLRNEHTAYFLEDGALVFAGNVSP